MFYLKSLTNNNIEKLFKINFIVFKKKIFIIICVCYSTKLARLRKNFFWRVILYVLHSS